MIIVLSFLWFAWFASCIQFSACFTWTKYPDPITRVWNGSTIALRWDYNLSPEEQSAAALLITRIWRRSNESHLVRIAVKDFNTHGGTNYVEFLKPHITISRSEEATLIISDVTKEDEALYKFTVSLLTLNNFLISRNTTLLVAVQPTVQCQSSVSVRKGEQAVLSCSVTGDPKPNITWTKASEPGNIISYNSTLVIDNVRISDGGKYNVTAYNGRSASELVTLNITYQPENVSLTTNTTSKVCTGVVISFTCTAEANPPVHTYLLYENDTVIKNIMGISGTWIKTMENAGQFVFRCEANNSVQGTGKSSDTFLTVDVPAFLEQAKNKVVRKEGESVEVYCNVTAGIPEPTVIWRKVKAGEPIPTERNLLNITNITREQAGNYSCTANNTCGEASTVVEIDVQSNPPVYNYLLSDDEDGFSFRKSGTWIKKLSKGGKVVYNCSAYQLLGNETSINSITLTVNVPISVDQPKNKTVEEGDNVEVYCNATGSPDPAVIWTKVEGGGYNPTEGKLLNITNITRAQAGDYRCTANNTCGEESTMANIDVRHKPDVHLTTNTTSEVCTGVVINFTCTAEANPPVHTYLLYENDTVIENMGISGT